MRNKLKKQTPNLIILFLYINPFLDIIAAFLIKNNISNVITSGIRILFMIYLTIYLLFTHYENKKKTLIYISLLITCILIHTGIIISYKGISSLSYELKNTLSTYYFVFLLTAFITIYKTNKFNKKHLKNVLIMYLLLTFIPGILGFSNESYDYSKTGKVGLFYSANVLGSTIIILFSYLLTYLKNITKTEKIIITITLLYTVFTIGTKVPVLGLIIILGINILYIIWKLIKQRKIKTLSIISSALLIILISLIIITPKTNFYKNIKIHLTFLEKQNIKITSLEFIDHFIFSSRFKKEEITRKNYNNSHTLEKVFGIGYIELNEDNKREHMMIEIDYFDIFYREGIIGFILYFIPVLYIIKENIKQTKLNFEGINKLTTLTLILLIAFFQGHIFVTPAISIFIALILVTNCIKEDKSVV